MPTAGRVGVVVLDFGRPGDTLRAVSSVVAEPGSPRVLVVENGPGPEPVLPDGVEVLRLARNAGFAGGMNAGIARLVGAGCDRVLLLNNDAVLEPGSLALLAAAVEPEDVAAAGPVVLRESDGRVESRGQRVDLRTGRLRLSGHGEPPGILAGSEDVQALSGAALMLAARAIARVGPLDEDYFFSFEDTDWCLRARAAGLRNVLVHGARARHGGSRTLGPASPDRLYYAVRNHLRGLDRARPLHAPGSWARSASVLALAVAHAVVQADVPRARGLRAVLQGALDFRRGRFGPREAR